MTISVTCQCGKVLEAEDKHAGRTGKCSNCGARLTLPSAPPAALDPETRFNEYRPKIADTPPLASAPTPAVSVPTVDEVFVEATDDDEEYFAELPPLPTRKSNAPKRSFEPVLGPDAFWRHFFAAWWCHWVLRLMGGLILALCMMAMLFIVFLSVAVLFNAKSAESFFQSSGGIVAFYIVSAPGFLLTLTTGFCLLAAAELLTAACWSYLRQGIGGTGPI